MADDEDRIREFYTDCSEVELLEDEPVELAEPSIESAVDVLERLAEREPELVAGFLHALRGASFDTLSKIFGCTPGRRWGSACC